VSRVGAGRIQELEQELLRAHAELDALRRERDELAAQLAAATAPPASPPPLPVLPVLDLDPADVADVVDAAEADDATDATDATDVTDALDGSDVDADGPVSLSGLVVSRRVPLELVGDERRRQPRQGCELEVEFLGDSHLITGLSQDISEGGVFVATYQQLPLGTTVTLGLELPGGRIEAHGVVRWLRQEVEELDQRPGFGVAFTQLSSDAVAALGAFCRQEPPRYYEI
jgi:uncharacterized protein (TIGR02266 family)